MINVTRMNGDKLVLNTELMSMPDIDGALVGGASLDAETFSQIVKY